MTRTLVLPLLAVAAFFTAQGIAHLVEVRLAPGVNELADAPLLPPEPPPAPAARSARPIVDRNPFDHESVPLAPPAGRAPSIAFAVPDGRGRVRAGSSTSEEDGTAERSLPETHIERALLDRVLRGEVNVTGLAHAVPVRESGRIVGVRLSRIDGLLARLGIRDGDELRSVNGLPVGTAEQAFAAWASLADARRLNVQLRRGGALVQLAFVID